MQTGKQLSQLSHVVTISGYQKWNCTCNTFTAHARDS